MIIGNRKKWVKYKKTRNRIIIISVLLLVIAVIIAVLAAVIHSFGANTPSNSTETTGETTTEAVTQATTQPAAEEKFSEKKLAHNNNNSAGYETKEKAEKGYKIFYPVTGSEHIDSRIMKDVAYFKSLVSQLNTPYQGVDYSAFISNKLLLSLVYEIQGYNDKGDVVSADYFTRVFKLNGGEELGQNDIFKDNFFEHASKKSREFFSKNDSTKQWTEQENYLNATSASPANYDRFAFDDSGCILYFDSKTIFEKPGTLYSVAFSYDEIYDMLKIEKDGSKKHPKNDNKNNLPLYIPKQGDIDLAKPMVALTYDDGPSSIHTPEILDVLEKHNARATFFVTGTNAKNNPDILKRQVNSGCQIGNHTMWHSNLTKQSESDMLKDVNDLSAIIENAAGAKVTLVRPPYGAFDDTVKRVLNQYALMLWNVDTMDWSSRDKNAIVKEVMENTSDGAIILLHDIHKETAQATKEFVPKLIEKGYQLVTIDELYYYRDKTLAGGNVYG